MFRELIGICLSLSNGLICPNVQYVNNDSKTFLLHVSDNNNLSATYFTIDNCTFYIENNYIEGFSFNLYGLDDVSQHEQTFSYSFDFHYPVDKSYFNLDGFIPVDNFQYLVVSTFLNYNANDSDFINFGIKCDISAYNTNNSHIFNISIPSFYTPLSEYYEDVNLNILNSEYLYKFFPLNYNYDYYVSYGQNQYSLGYNAGHNASITDEDLSFKNLITTIFTAPITALKTMFDFTIFGVNVKSIILFLLTISLIIFVIGMFKKRE